MVQTISGYSFSPADLKVASRRPGISAFMRIRNGADFLEATIRSHLPFFDEIVAVYNQCTDATPEILDRLAQEFGGRLKVCHYADRVFPPGSADHAATPPNSPHSLVNYYNAALSLTSCRIATKLDDDHLAIPEPLGAVVRRLRETDGGMQMHCFSGLNVLRTAAGTLGIPAHEPVSGGGDIGFFPVTHETHFAHDRRFERFCRGGLRRVFAGFLYWHLKFLKPEMGFANYELERYPGSRYARRQAALAQQGARAITLQQLVKLKRTRWRDRLAALVSSKHRLLLERDRALVRTFGGASLEAAVENTTDPELRKMVLKGSAP